MTKKIGRNDQCWCGSGKKYKTCHLEFDKKIESLKSKGHIVPSRDLIKTPEDIEGIKKSAAINIAALDAVAEQIKAGMTTQQIDDIVRTTTESMGGIPAPLNYQGYPKSVCTSINDVVCHGIPSDDVILMDGDIVNVDCSTIYNGYFSDSSRMFCIGDVDPIVRKLVEDTKKSIEIGLEHVKPWGFLGDMGQAINDFAKSQGYSIVEQIGGHGIGKEFHEDPWVGYTTEAGTEMVMAPGLCFTIEPMINLGGPDIVEDPDDGWTIYTEDYSPSAQWEVQLVITEDGYELLSW